MFASPHAVYVHVPFCEQICHYCDFNKFYLKNQPIEDYLQSCHDEMKNTVNKTKATAISSIYVGGGTPTSLSTSQLETLLKSITIFFPLTDKYEWTVEVNPSGVTREKLEMLHNMGVNRLSIGAQTFDAALLKAIGRDHVPEDIERTIETARSVGFSNISLDLMFGLPNQSVEQFIHTVNKAITLEVEHISAYSLKVEPRTVFYQLWNKGKLSLPEEDNQADMYEALRASLLENGYQHYEISNFSKEGFASQHNLTYWKNEFYYGIGAGAHSYVDGVRRMNHGPLPKYMASVKGTGFPYREEHIVTKKEKMEEEMFMGLRVLDGVSQEPFFKKYGMEINDVFSEAVKNLIHRGLLTDDGTHIKLSEKGLLLGNEVFEKFLLGDD